ncbi:MAG: RNA 2',3'-cyclic phosphodiesterase [Actinomycetota bacterium]|nr:RNA 2',3'-cyclic phosphodiesterase [Actinomycetota bacterium]
MRLALAGWSEAALGDAATACVAPAGGDSSWRTVAAAGLHVTLCFLGGQPLSEIEAITAACATITGCPRMPLQLGDILWLPRRRPRVLAVGLTDPDGVLGALQAALADRLQHGGWYERERRRFMPHITVARARGHASRRLGQALSAPSALSFEGASVALLRSWPQPGGSRYERLAVISLSEKP